MENSSPQKCPEHTNSLLNVTKGSIMALTYLVLSVVSNTTDQTILLDMLYIYIYYGISDLACSWPVQIIPVTQSTVNSVICNLLSHPLQLQFGVP